MESHLQKIASFLFVTGTLFLVYWPKVYNNGSISILRFELFFFLASIFFLLSVFYGRHKKKLVYTRIDKKISLISLGFIAGIVIATILAMFRENLFFNFAG